MDGWIDRDPNSVIVENDIVDVYSHCLHQDTLCNPCDRFERYESKD